MFRDVVVYARFTGKHQCWRLLLKKWRPPAQVFSSKFCEIFKHTCFIEQLYLTASVKSTILIYCKLFPKFRYFSNILPKSKNLISLENYYQVEHHCILLIYKERNDEKKALSLSKRATIWIFNLQF